MTLSTSAAAVTFEDVTAVLGGRRVLDRVSLAVPAGGSTMIVGPNGAGKTTLLCVLLGMLAHQGRVVFAGGQRPRIGYVPQRLVFDAGIPVTALEYVGLAWRRLPLWLGLGRRCRARALAALALTDAADVAERRLGALSGGELRRVLLAAALAREPRLLVLDEPTAGVDFQGEAAFHRRLDRLRQERGFTQITVCHNLDLVRRHASQAVCLAGRVMAVGAPEAALSPDILAKTFIGQEQGGGMEVAHGLFAEATHA